MEGAADRQFYSIPNANEFLKTTIKNDGNEVIEFAQSQEKQSDFLNYVGNNVIGSNKTFSGPYGLRTALYLDFVASGRALQFIEDYIQNEVLPEYANTHTTTSITSLQTTLFRHEARDILRNSCNASEHDSVIFVGTGTTAAVHKLIHGLNLSEPPIVFVGPFEHHSNILPWIEAGAEVIRISSTSSGQVDLDQLESYLVMIQPFGKQMIGVFSAASNVTGILSNVDAVTICLHRYGALAFWDYAAAAPYLKVDMNPYVGGDNQALVYKDAIYFSVHKFIGGVDCPGVLIVKKKLLKNPVPHGCGGGTVFFVRRDHHCYLVEPEMKEEGGTPNIVGAIRAGLVFQLKDTIGTDVIKRKDTSMLSQAAEAWSACPNLVILGSDPLAVSRLPIISFLVYHPTTGLFLHHNFVTAILNDVFGIQARGGCACAGPYAMDILGMKETVSEKIEELLAEDSRLDRVHLRRVGEYSHREIIRPGFVRINLPYILTTEGLQFVIQALSLVAKHAWKLLPQYLFNPETGEWRHKQFQTFKDRKWLGHISYSSGRMSYQPPAQVVKGPLPTCYQDCLDKAREIFTQAEKVSIKLPDQSVMFDEEARLYRWFLLPSEANLCLQNKWRKTALPPTKLPFCPAALLEQHGYAECSMETESEATRVEELVEKLKQNVKLNDKLECEGKKQCDVDNVTEKNLTSKIQFDQISQSSEIVDALSRGFFVSDDSENIRYVDEHESSMPSSSGDFSGQELKSKNKSAVCEQDSVLSSDSKNRSFPLSSSVPKANPVDKKACKDNQCVSLKVGGQDFSETPNVNGHMAEELDKTGTISIGDLSIKDKAQESSNDKGTKKNKIGGWYSPPKAIFKPTVQAIEEYSMVQDGDKVLVCLSGGKDSLSLLHTLRQYQFYARKKGVVFDLGAVTVDPETPSYDPSPLKKYLASLNVPYFYESQCIMETANNLPYECASICSFCSRMKRGRIYAAARREGYNVLALGQHLDDLTESFMMSFLHNGSLNTMKAHYTVKEGDLRVIRPFVYVRETELRHFAEQNQLPVIAENCPACFEAPKERHRTKQLLASQEILFPQVYNSMMAALKPLMARGRQSGNQDWAGVTVPVPNVAEEEDDDDLDI